MARNGAGASVWGRPRSDVGPAGGTGKVTGASRGASSLPARGRPGVPRGSTPPSVSSRHLDEDEARLGGSTGNGHPGSRDRPRLGILSVPTSDVQVSLD